MLKPKQTTGFAPPALYFFYPGRMQLLLAVDLGSKNTQ
jgi:hypothetical protein